MKTKIVMLCLVVGSWGAYAQHNHGPSGGNSAPAHRKKEKDSHGQFAAPEFQMQLREVVMASLQLKEALVSSDAAKASSSITEIKNSISKVDLSQLKNEALMDWLSYLKVLNENLDPIANSNDLVTQRKCFALFNEALYKSVKMFGVNGLSIYYDHCPMANDSEGAYWLTLEKEIKNPYFGDKMLTCGSVKEMIH